MTKNARGDHLKPNSLWPLTPEQVLARAFQVPPLKGTAPQGREVEDEARTQQSPQARDVATSALLRPEKWGCRATLLTG